MSRQVLLSHQKLWCSPPFCTYASRVVWRIPSIKGDRHREFSSNFNSFLFNGFKSNKEMKQCSRYNFYIQYFATTFIIPYKMSKFLYKRFINPVSTSSCKSRQFVPVHTMTVCRECGSIAALICNLSKRRR